MIRSRDGKTLYERDPRTGTVYRVDGRGVRMKRLGKAAKKRAKRLRSRTLKRRQQESAAA